MGEETEAYAGCLSDHAVTPPAWWITVKMLLARTNSHGKTGAQSLAGSWGSFRGSIARTVPSVREAPGAPPFNRLCCISMPSSYSVVKPVGFAPGVQGPGPFPLPVITFGPSR